MATFWATFCLRFSPKYAVSKHGLFVGILRSQRFFDVIFWDFKLNFVIDILAFLAWSWRLFGLLF
jgi:hypothetical protein